MQSVSVSLPVSVLLLPVVSVPVQAVHHRNVFLSRRKLLPPPFPSVPAQWHPDGSADVHLSSLPYGSALPVSGSGFRVFPSSQTYCWYFPGLHWSFRPFPWCFRPNGHIPGGSFPLHPCFLSAVHLQFWIFPLLHAARMRFSLFPWETCWHHNLSAHSSFLNRFLPFPTAAVTVPPGVPVPTKYRLHGSDCLSHSLTFFVQSLFVFWILLFLPPHQKVRAVLPVCRLRSGQSVPVQWSNILLFRYRYHKTILKLLSVGTDCHWSDIHSLRNDTDVWQRWLPHSRLPVYGRNYPV